MPLLITTKLKDGGEGGHLALFLSLGIGWTFQLFLNSSMSCANAHAYLCYTMVMVMISPLLSRRYTFVDLNEKNVLA